MVTAGTVYKRTVLAISYLSLGLYLYSTLRKLRKWAIRRPHLAHALHSPCCTTPADDKFEKEASRVARISHRALLLSAARVLHHVCAISTLGFAVASTVWWGVWKHNRHSLYFSATDMGLLIFLLTLALELRPQLLPTRCIEIIYAVFMLLISWYCTTLRSVYLLLFLQPVVTLTRIVLTAMMDNMYLAFALNLCCSMCIALQYSFLHVEASDTNVSKSLGFNSRMWMFLQQGMVACVVVAICYTLNSQRLAEARASLEASAEKIQRSAFAALLDIMSHVVVELDETLRIVGDASRLSALLLHGPERSLVGQSLHDLMPAAEDREKFLEHFESRTSKQIPGSADVLNVLMRDSCNEHLRMEIIPVSFTAIGGSMRHLIGIRESDKEEPEAEKEETQEHSMHAPSSQKNRSSRKPIQSKGTQRKLQAEELSDTASVTSQERKIMPLMAPDYAQTNPDALLVLVMSALWRCNIQLQPVCCCPFHSSVKEFSHALKSLKRLPCQQKFGPLLNSTIMQCSECGVFDAVSVLASPAGCGICNLLGRDETHLPSQLKTSL
eukprot:TRINITY_DN62670_c0_g1_i1.p1 TRINITY_DN62670_c0_g1~~TRINITY_DN62670_c0_g1_i1.p1  ORF type:complete len:554 (-),score=62.47 TRINITY_DN62670_c0_g1_i1:36-1697(-)